jgi:hypothetical protein
VSVRPRVPVLPLADGGSDVARALYRVLQQCLPRAALVPICIDNLQALRFAPKKVLCCAVLCCAVLCCAVLCCAVLCCAVLCCAALGVKWRWCV